MNTFGGSPLLCGIHGNHMKCVKMLLEMELTQQLKLADLAVALSYRSVQKVTESHLWKVFEISRSR